MTDLKLFFGIFAVLTSIVGYVPYFFNIYRKKTKPHAFSWFVWTTTAFVIFIGQTSSHAGAGAWLTMSLIVINLLVFGSALLYGERHITRGDWVSLCCAGIALFLWWIVKDPLISIIFATGTDLIGFYPTMRKSFYKPYEETVTTFIFSTSKYVFAFFALEIYTIETWFFPVMLFFGNLALVLEILIRRKLIKK